MLKPLGPNQRLMTEVPIVDVGPNLRIIGTAHVSSASVEAVRSQIEVYEPEIVAVELCATRRAALEEDRRLDRESLRTMVREGRAPLVLMQSMLAAEQRRMGLAEGEQPGSELVAAVQEAEARELNVELVDRDIQTTLRRAWANMGLRERLRLLWSLITPEEEEEEELDLGALLADQDLLTSLMEEVKAIAPGAGAVLIDERDEYLARNLDAARQRGKVLAVVGAGHLEGIRQRLEDGFEPSPERLVSLDELPRRAAWRRAMPWAVPAVMAALVGWLIWSGDREALIEASLIWLGANAALSAMGCIIARGHPLAVLTAAVASPFTSLSPALAAGWFAGYVQLRYDEPTAEDLQTFLKLEQVSDFWRNSAGRVLLVTALTNLGSVAGTYVGLAIVGAFSSA